MEAADSDESPPEPMASRADAPPEGVSAECWRSLHETIERKFGIPSLRPMQAAAMGAVLSNRDLLLVLPTGGGKSLCYQAPALVREGVTLVISPLIALMKDQVDGLRSNGVAAGMLTSAQSYGERREVTDALAVGALDIVFVAPERLMLDGFLERLGPRISALAVDEAHCISHWGHDFRPEYRQIGELRRQLPDLAVHAFTATATASVRNDIIEQLGLRDPEVLIAPCDRPNLTYRVRPRRDLTSQVLEVVGRHDKDAGIVYCISRKDTESLATSLADAGVRAAAYHAGLNPELRRRTQERFLSEELDVIVATVAFGMGIDRPDVRFVVHAALPKGLEPYSQESGRAGRDGLPSECVLLFGGGDYPSWLNLMERGAQGNEGPLAEAALEASRRRLGDVMRYATSGVCRHKQLVEYFSQEYVPPTGDTERGCGACDVCLDELSAVEDSVVIAQKILSCVVRADQRYGASHIADILRGANTARIRRAGHDTLSTFGLLPDQTVSELRAWIDQLVGLDHLRTTGGQYPTLFLTQSGVQVMRAEEPIQLYELPRPPKAKRSRSRTPSVDQDDPENVDEGLFEDLRSFRRELARERGVPPYIIFNDRTLRLMAAEKPGDMTAFRAIKGVGEKKAADLGETFIERINAWGTTASGSSPASAPD